MTDGAGGRNHTQREAGGAARMIARLIKPDGTIAREWLTDRPDLANTADRNCPAAWKIETVETAINFGYTTENVVDTRSA